jgi:hypothetical protein
VADLTEGQNKLNAGLRYAGTAFGTLGFIFGAMQFVTPEQVAQLTAAVHDFNNSMISAYGALTKMWIIIGPAMVITLAKFGIDSSTVKAIGDKLLRIATGPASPGAVEAQKAAINVTAAVALDKTIPTSEEAKNTLVQATIALPQVEQIISDKKTAIAAGSPSVTTSPTTRLQ